MAACKTRSAVGRAVVVVLALAVAACTGNSASTASPVKTETPTTGASSSPTATAPPSTSPPHAPSLSPSPSPKPTPAPIALCAVKQLSAAIVAGSVNNASGGKVLFSVQVKNAGTVACTLRKLDLVKMVDSNGYPMFVGPGPATSPLLTVVAGQVLRTMLQAFNFCAGVPTEPVTVWFVLPGGAGTLKAKPLAANPGSIIPPCFQGGYPGSISMSGWAP